MSETGNAAESPDMPVSSATELPLELGPLADSIGFFVMLAGRKLSHEWLQQWPERERRPMFYSAFALIGTNPGISPAELAHFLELDKSRASDLLDTLEAERSISRRRHSEDQRRQGIYLTPAGTAKLATVLMRMREGERRLQRLFGAAERQGLLDALRKIVEAL